MSQRVRAGFKDHEIKLLVDEVTKAVKSVCFETPECLRGVISKKIVTAFSVVSTSRDMKTERLLALATKHCPTQHHDFDEIKEIAKQLADA